MAQRRGDRGSYRVWEEGNVFPQVIFEVYSPSTTAAEYPNRVEAWLRSGEDFVRVNDIDAFVSPRVGFRFVLEDGHLTIFGSDGRKWKSIDVAFCELEDIKSELARAEKERERARADADI